MDKNQILMIRHSILLLCFLIIGCSVKAQPHPATTKHAKNVILMIGDGTGLSHISAALYASPDGLALERFPVTGLIKTHSSNDLITDSAAGATAIASGTKTYNGAITVDSDTVACRTILEQGEDRGYSTGLIATSTIVHATPAAFVAHVASRQNYEVIAEHFLGSGIDYFVGGGMKYFTRREDGQDLLRILEQSGYLVGNYFRDEFSEFKPDSSKNYAFLTADDDPLPVAQGRDYLLPATRRALSYLPQRSDSGFFLMVEGSQIDWGGHANNTDYLISELLDFDQAIEAALEFAIEDGETLVVVTADHECGGFAINPGSRRDSIVGEFTTDYHTGSMVPVFAFGPGSGLFSGIYDNTEIYDKIRKAVNWDQKGLK